MLFTWHLSIWVPHALANSPCSMTIWKENYYADFDKKRIRCLKDEAAVKITEVTTQYQGWPWSQFSVLMQMLCTELNRNLLVSFCHSRSDSSCIKYLRMIYTTTSPASRSRNIGWQVYTCAELIKAFLYQCRAKTILYNKNVFSVNNTSI